MSERKPFLPTEAKDALPDEGDFLLPVCLPTPGLLIGQDLAVLVFTTIEGQRVGMPMAAQSLSELRDVIDEALRMMQAPDGGTVQ